MDISIIGKVIFLKRKYVLAGKLSLKLNENLLWKPFCGRARERLSFYFLMSITSWNIFAEAYESLVLLLRVR